MKQHLLETITALSHEFGSTRYVRGGGGNTSVKDDQTLWVKPSGTTLAGMVPELFVAMDRSAIGALYRAETPPEPAAREELVKNLMQAAVGPGSAGRPSVEAPLHNTFDARYVVHTHPALVNGLTCALQGAQACAKLFPDALWFPYTDPGYTLCMEVRQALSDYVRANGRQPSVLMLQNHGVFVAGDTADAIRETYARILRTVESAYASAGVTCERPVQAGIDDAAVQAETEKLRTLLGDDAAFIVCSGHFDVAPGPLTPDHLVYAKAFPLCSPISAQSVAHYREMRGYAPRVVCTEHAVYGLGSTPKNAALALEFALDAAQVHALTSAFGGVQWMSDQARLFIENWEVESYRAKVAS